MAISWFFEKPYETPVAALNASDRSWVLNSAGFNLRTQGRFAEALPPLRAALSAVSWMAEKQVDWLNIAIGTSNLSQTELFVGEVSAAIATAEQSIANADRSGNDFQMLATRTILADALHAAGHRDEAKMLFVDAERRQKEWQPVQPLLYSLSGYRYCELLLSNRDHAVARDRAARALELARLDNQLLSIALDTLTLGRAILASAAENAAGSPSASTAQNDTRIAAASLDQAAEGLRASGSNDHLPRGLLARAAFRRSVGDWDGAARDLDEVEEIAEPGPMRLFQCDAALERARLAFAKLEAFAPLNGLVDDSARKLDLPDGAEAARLTEEATANLATARELIAKCGYHRRDEELAELEDVAAGRRRFADLSPRV